MNNPWLHLPHAAPFILPEDADSVAKFNERCHPDKKIHTELPPEPYAGRRDAPIVLLMRRPGYHPDDETYMLKDAAFAASMERTRAFEKQEYPFYHLNGKYPENPGFHYWNKRLKEPIQEVGLHACAQNFLLLQLYPYKTNAYIKEVLPSFSFTKEILYEAMQRKAIIIHMVGASEWNQHVPELKDYNCFTCKSSINPTISEGNIGKEGYKQVLDAINKSIPA